MSGLSSTVLCCIRRQSVIFSRHALMQACDADSEQMFHAGRFLNTKTIASVFFIIDIICIGVQGAGSAIISSTLQENGKASTAGGNIVLIGLAIQLLFFATFSVVTAYVYHLQRTKASNRVPFQIYVCLLATILLITMRNAYRVVEIAVSRAAPFCHCQCPSVSLQPFAQCV